MDRHNYSFVIFPTEEGNDNNDNFNISALLQQFLNGMNNSNAGTGNTPAPNGTQQQETPTGSATSLVNDNRQLQQQQHQATDTTNGTPVVSISYIYVNEASQNAENGTNQPSTTGTSATSETATNAPRNNTNSNDTTTNNTPNANNPQAHATFSFNFPNNQNENPNLGLNRMIEIVANLAVQAITNVTRRNNGINKETFDSFPLRSKQSLTDVTCPICFDEYEENAPKKEEKQTKRKRGDVNDDDDGNETDSKKPKNSDTPSSSIEPSTEPLSTSEQSPEELLNAFRATQVPDILDSSPSMNSRPTTSGTTTASTEQTEDPDPYLHIPVELPCHHVFGRSCLYEWLKSNNSCPLCRETVHQDHAEQQSNNASSPLSPVFVILNRSTPNVSNDANASPSPGSSNTATRPNTNGAARTTRPQSPFAGFFRSAGQDAGQRSNNQQTPFSNFFGPIPGISNPPINTTPTTASPGNPPRSSFTANLLRNLSNIGNTDSLFSSGVASRRTNNGVETYSLNGFGGRNNINRNQTNNSASVPNSASSSSSSSSNSGSSSIPNRTNDFFQESSRLLQERMTNNFLSNILGFDLPQNNTNNSFHDFVTERFQEELRRSNNVASSSNARNEEPLSNNASSSASNSTSTENPQNSSNEPADSHDSSNNDNSNDA